MRYTLSPAQTDDIETVFRLNRELIDKHENVGAVRLYKRLGFEVVETVHDTRYRMRYDKNGG